MQGSWKMFLELSNHSFVFHISLSPELGNMGNGDIKCIQCSEQKQKHCPPTLSRPSVRLCQLRAPFCCQNSSNAVRRMMPHYRPCRIRSASCLFPNSHAFRKPCSDSSMFFIDVMSCAGGLLTREATMTGSVSRMMPSSTSSSTASDWRG
jgi:hypothetical protein